MTLIAVGVCIMEADTLKRFGSSQPSEYIKQVYSPEYRAGYLMVFMAFAHFVSIVVWLTDSFLRGVATFSFLFGAFLVMSPLIDALVLLLAGYDYEKQWWFVMLDSVPLWFVVLPAIGAVFIVLGIVIDRTCRRQLVT